MELIPGLALSVSSLRPGDTNTHTHTKQTHQTHTPKHTHHGRLTLLQSRLQSSEYLPVLIDGRLVLYDCNLGLPTLLLWSVFTTQPCDSGGGSGLKKELEEAESHLLL